MWTPTNWKASRKKPAGSGRGYTYVHNNPLASIDPSGHLSWGPGPISYALTGDFIGAATGHQLNRIIARDPMAAQLAVTIVGTVTGAFCGPCSIGFTALASADMGYYQTGGNWDVAVQQGIIAAYSAMMFYVAGTAAGDSYGLKVAYNGMAGGIMAEVQGGKFGHGFLSAGVTAAVSPAIQNLDSKFARSIVAGVIGGTASKISGGKFANGAVTAAMAYALSHGLNEAKAARPQAQEEGWKPGWHKDRNENQSCPATCADLDQGQYWEEGKARLHGGDEGYFTYRGNSDAAQGYQCTYSAQCTGISSVDQSIRLIRDPNYAGTYDYIPPTRIGDTNIWNPVTVAGHFFIDVVPYYIWGN